MLKPDDDDELVAMFMPIMTMPRDTPMMMGAARLMTRISRLLSMAILMVAGEMGLDPDETVAAAEKALAKMREDVVSIVRVEAEDMRQRKKKAH